MHEARKDIIAKLQKDILRWQGFTPTCAGKEKGIGLGPLEKAFPNGVFPVGAIHEMVCPTLEHAAATGGLMAGLLYALMQKGSACLWIGRTRTLFPPSLAAFNVHPDQMIFVDLQHEKDILWVMEQALKCEGLAAVIAEVRGINIIQSRRLQLAVESSRVTGFLLRNDPQKLSASTCVARWQITPLPSELENGLPGVGSPRWQVDLLRVRNGNPGSWKIEWDGTTFIPIEEQRTLTETRQVG